MNPELIFEVAVECDWVQAQQWCHDNIGEFNVDWFKLGIDPMASILGDDKTYWYFKNQEDATMFRLRWLP